MIKESIIKKNRILLLIFVLFLFLHFFRIITPAENMIWSFADSVKVKLYSSGIFLNSYFKKKENVNLKKEIEKIQIDNVKLLTANAKMHNVQMENDSLRKLLNFTKDKKYSYIVANVVSKSLLLNTKEQNNNLIIDKGSYDGIEPGLAVVNLEGVVIGKISEVKDRSALLVLISNNSCKYAAMIQNGSGTSGVIEGSLGLTMDMRFVPQSENVQIGNLVVTSGLEQKIPSGLLLGKVAEVKKDSNGIWQSVVVDPIVSLDNLKIVSVLKK